MLIIRKAKQSDSKDVFEWRNDKLTRKMSHSSEVITWQKHCKWFNSSLRNKKRLIFMCVDRDLQKNIAVVRFDIQHPRALLSINIAPSMRGKGKAKLCLNSAIQVFKTLHTKIKFIDAEVQSVNIASKRAFTSAGFTLVGERAEVLLYECNL